MESVFLFDGDCAFCSSCARFIERHIPGPVAVVAWQWADLPALGLTREECLEAVQFVGGADRSAGPAAIADLLRTSTMPWRWAGRLLATRPVMAVARPVYRWVSRHRHQMPGGTAACAVPQR